MRRILEGGTAFGARSGLVARITSLEYKWLVRKGSSSNRTCRSVSTSCTRALRQQPEGEIWRFKTGGQSREKTARLGRQGSAAAWSTSPPPAGAAPWRSS